MFHFLWFTLTEGGIADAKCALRFAARDMTAALFSRRENYKRTERPTRQHTEDRQNECTSSWPIGPNELSVVVVVVVVIVLLCVLLISVCCPVCIVLSVLIFFVVVFLSVIA